MTTVPPMVSSGKPPCAYGEQLVLCTLARLLAAGCRLAHRAAKKAALRGKILRRHGV
jgi:hypothetical protein